MSEIMISYDLTAVPEVGESQVHAVIRTVLANLGETNPRLTSHVVQTVRQVLADEATMELGKVDPGAGNDFRDGWESAVQVVRHGA